MENLHNEAIEERIEIIRSFTAVKNYSKNWTDGNGNLKKSACNEELFNLIAFSVFFMLIIIAKGLFLLQTDTFLRELADIGFIDVFTLLFLVIYFDIVQFRTLWGHRQRLLLLQNAGDSTESLYVLNDKLSALSGIKWKYAVLMAIMIGLLLFSEFSAVQPPFLNYLGIFSPIIITLAFVLAFQHFQVILQNVQQFETLLFVENNVKLTNVKPEI